MKYSPYRGFTLIEIMVVGAIGSIILGSLLAFFIRGFRAVDTGEKVVELQQELNRAFVWISDDLKQTARSVIVLPSDGQWRDTVLFKIPLGVSSGKLVWSANNVAYKLIADGLSRSYGLENMTVASSLKETMFRRMALNPGEVEVRLTAAGQTPFGNVEDSLLFKVKMRNQ